MVARLITEEVATLETELDVEDQHVAARAESRWTILFMGGVVVGFAAVLNSVPTMHEIFLSPRGQLGLIASMAIFAVTAMVMALLLRSPGMSRWDLTRMHRELLGGGGDFRNGRGAGMSSGVVVALLCAMAVGRPPRVWQRVWEPNHVVLSASLRQDGSGSGGASGRGTLGRLHEPRLLAWISRSATSSEAWSSPAVRRRAAASWWCSCCAWS